MSKRGHSEDDEDPDPFLPRRTLTRRTTNPGLGISQLPANAEPHSNASTTQSFSMGVGAGLAPNSSSSDHHHSVFTPVADQFSLVARMVDGPGKKYDPEESSELARSPIQENSDRATDGEPSQTATSMSRGKQRSVDATETNSDIDPAILENNKNLPPEFQGFQKLHKNGHYCDRESL